MEKLNRMNKRRNRLLAGMLLTSSERIKSFSKETLGTDDILLIDQETLKGFKRRKKESVVMTWIHYNRFIYRDANLNNRISENEQNNRQSHKFHLENHKNWKVN